ncbi:MAG: DUF4928 domain-containing protein [Planctomycetota bacterium]|nr:MAG: DUF4928 domain-containing protein [Planctomycetota bacterium]
MNQGDKLTTWIGDWSDTVGLRAENRGNVAAVLVVLRRIKSEASLRAQLSEIFQQVDNPKWRGFAALSLFVTANEGQISGITGPRVQSILLDHQITGKYLGIDGGRSSRGNFRPVRNLLSSMPAVAIDSAHATEVEALIDAWEETIIERFVRPALQPDPIVVSMATGDDSEVILKRILDAADERSICGPVAQHLVGAKLERRYRKQGLVVENHSCFAQDKGLDRNADFTVHNFAFHVTISPTKALVRRWEQNASDSLSCRVLVREHQRESTKRLLESNTTRRVSVHGIESFVGLNVDEMSTDDQTDAVSVLADLFSIYNRRVREVERDSTGMEIEVRGQS